jgi:YD repeat-containing protein
VSTAPELAEPSASTSLFNGNIASWSSKSLGVATQATAPTLTAEHYRYDQLNRLVASEQRAPSGGSWTATNQYGTSYAYDPNGNLTSLTRQAGQSGQNMDQLSYGYPLDGQGNIASNQLRHVKDAVGAGVSNEDVDSQPDDNYRYDAVGNLTKDDQGGVRQISWTPYGKIGKIEKADGTVVTYRYDAQGNRIAKLLQSATGPSLTTYYVRDATGNLLAVYEQEPGQTLRLVEQPLYGSARVGERKPGLLLPDPNAAGRPLVLADGVSVSRGLGQKYYEVTDHLGNVRAVVTDQKTSTLDATTGQPVLTSLLPVLSNYYNYYAFGQLQPGRYGYGNTGSAAPAYRFGFNGQEKADEISRGQLIAEHWNYDSRIARRWEIDPVSKPWQSNYSVLSNSPIWKVDPDGADDIFSSSGKFVKHINNKTNYILIEQRGIKPVRIDHFNGKLKWYSSVDNDNRQVLARIVTYYARQVGITGLVGVQAKEGPTQTEIAEFDPKDKGIWVSLTNGYVDEKVAMNSFLLKNVLEHEKFHKEDDAKGVSTSFVTHARVYIRQMMTENFNSLPETMQNAAAVNMLSYLQAARMENEDGWQKALEEFNRTTCAGVRLEYAGDGSVGIRMYNTRNGKEFNIPLESYRAKTKE